jgi:hypothetical protein
MGLDMGAEAAGVKCACKWSVMVGGAEEAEDGSPARSARERALESFREHVGAASTRQAYVESRCPFEGCDWAHRNRDPASDEAARLAETAIRNHLDGKHPGWNLADLKALAAARAERSEATR